MTTATTVPITITPEAVAFVQERGWEQEFEQLLEHTLQTVSGLLSIHGVREINFTHEGDLGVTLEATRETVSDPTSDIVDQEWGFWLLQHFSPDICLHFRLISNFEDGHGR